MSQTEAAAERVPPHSVQAEHCVIGSILLDCQRVLDCCQRERITPEAFYIPACRTLYAVMLDVAASGKPVDVVTLQNALTSRNQWEEIGGGSFVDMVIDETPTAAHAEHYIDILKKKWRARDGIQLIREHERILFTNQDAPEKDLSELIQKLVDLTAGTTHLSKKEARRLIMQRARQAQLGQTIGLATPWKNFNDRIGGAPFGEPTIVAGREGTRKSYLVNQWAIHASITNGIPGAYFALEDGTQKAMSRSACIIAGLNYWRMFVMGRSTDTDLDRLDKACEQIEKSDLTIIGDRGYNIDGLALEIARGVARYGWRFAFVDAFKDVYGKGREQSEQEIYKVNRLSDIARQHDIALIVVHHVNKSLAEDDGYSVDLSGNQRLSYRDITGRAEITKAARMILMLSCLVKRDPLTDERHLVDYLLDCQKFTDGTPGWIALIPNRDTQAFELDPSRANKF